MKDNGGHSGTVQDSAVQCNNKGQQRTVGEQNRTVHCCAIMEDNRGQSETVHDSAVQCRTIEDRVRQYNTVQDNGGQSGILQDSAVQCRMLQERVVQCSPEQDSTGRYRTVQDTARRRGGKMRETAGHITILGTVFGSSYIKYQFALNTFRSLLLTVLYDNIYITGLTEWAKVSSASIA